MGADEAARVAQALAGDERAFAELLRPHHAPLLGLLRRMLHNREDAEDVLQETCLRAYRYLHRFDRSRPFGPWLTRIGVNLARDRLAQRARRREVSLDQTPAGREGESSEPYAGEWLADEGTLREVEHGRLLDAARRALATLPDEQRLVLEMRWLAEMSYAEVASALAIPIGTVMSRLSRGRRAIQTALAAERRVTP